LYGFGNKKVEALGMIEMNVNLGTEALMRIEMVTFDVVNIPYAYKAIFVKGIIRGSDSHAIFVHEDTDHQWSPNNIWSSG
jgi:hypothetical protein